MNSNLIEKKPKWELPSSKIEHIAERLMEEHPMPPHFARIIALRGITTYSEAEAFINPKLEDLRDPFLIKDMEIAVERVKRAMKTGERIMILGDYDGSQNRYQRSVLAEANEEVLFLGAIYDTWKLNAFRYYTRLYIHGHTVGGTNPSLVEALGAGIYIKTAKTLAQTKRGANAIH